MKQLTLLLLTIGLLSSCSDRYAVKLPNNSIVKVYDDENRGYNIDDTVCIRLTPITDSRWNIDNMGNMRDTSTTYSDFKIGIIIKIY